MESTVDIFLDRLKPKKQLLEELKIDVNTKVTGFVGRYSFEKRPETFLKLAAKLKNDTDTGPVHFIMVGSGNDQSNRELSKLISKYDLEHNISLLGVRNDIPSILSSLDVLVSTSVDEAFGLVLVEALAWMSLCFLK